MKDATQPTLVLAVSPGPRGFAYAAFEGPQTLLDWGLKKTRLSRYAYSCREFAALLDWYRPDLVVFEEDTDPRSPRRHRVEVLADDLEEQARARGRRTERLGRQRVAEVFSEFGATRKFQRDRLLGQWFPELAKEVTTRPPNAISERHATDAFDAIALALVHFYLSA